MKKIILLITLLSTFTLAMGTPLLLKSFHTNEEINISSIANYSSQFKRETQDEKDIDFEIVLFDSVKRIIP